MPSPNNVTELIMFVGGALIVVVAFLIASRFTGIGKRLTGDWKPGPIELTPLDDQPPRQHQPYVDPLARLKPHYAIIPVLILMLFAFIYYFLTKNTFQSGN